MSAITFNTPLGVFTLDASQVTQLREDTPNTTVVELEWGDEIVSQEPIRECWDRVLVADRV